LMEAHSALVPDMLNGVIPTPIESDVSELVRCLCHPDPSCRGHSKNLSPNAYQFGLERFITRFDLLAKKSSVLSREYK
jgi:hypothetical protein